MRRPTPRKTQALALFQNNHTCCICRIDGKHVQIHHIDGNPSNNDIQNLAVVCLDCHGKITGTSGLGKSYSALEVSMYKKTWESLLKRKRSLGLRRPSSPSESTEFKLEVKKILYAIAWTNKISEIKQKLELLYIYNIYGIDSYYILNELYYLTPFFYSGEKGKCVSTKIVSFFDYLIGPDIVKLKEKDLKALRLGIKVLVDIGISSAQYNRNVSLAIPTLISTLDSLYQLSLLIDNYEKYQLIPTIKNGLKSIKETALTEFKGMTKLRNLSRKCEYYLSKIPQKK